MKIQKKAWAALATIAAAGLLLAGCSGGGSSSPSSSASASASSTSSASSTAPATVAQSSFNAAVNSIVNPSTTPGGTLNLVSTADCDSWDPAITYYGWCWNMQQLFTRTLVSYQNVNGTTFKLAPDLATNLGVHNANYTSWTFTLKSGLKFSTGAAITPEDVKYGIERLYASQVTGGGPGFYFTGLLNAPANYAGPYANGAPKGSVTGELPASAISTTSDSITFHLKQPYADFDYLVALDASAPVPAKTEGGASFYGVTYTKHPVSSGPYEIKSYTPNQSITFVKNPYWSQSTDTIRHPLVDQVNLTIDTSSTDIANKLKQGTFDAIANTGAAGVSTAFQSQVLTTPSLKQYADDPAADATDYLTVQPSVIPNVWCRAAIFQATDKESLVAAYGGAAAGTLANSMTPPGIPGYTPSANVWPTGATNEGDDAAAKADLVKCGKPNGFSTKFAYSTAVSYAPAVFQAEQSALAKVGITLTAATANGSVYYKSFLGSPSTVKSQGLGIGMAGWGADFTTGYGFWQNIANGASIAPVGNSNYPSLNDPVVNGILNNSLTGKTTAADWTKLNTQVAKDAVYLPVLWEQTLYYHNPRLTNVTSNNAQAFGIYDFVNVGVNK